MLQAIQPGMTRTLRRSLFAGASGLAVALSLGLGVGAAAAQTAPRDHFIGWNSALREKNLPLVVNNARFLILDTVAMEGLRPRPAQGFEDAELGLAQGLFFHCASVFEQRVVAEIIPHRAAGAIAHQQTVEIGRGAQGVPVFEAGVDIEKIGHCVGGLKTKGLMGGDFITSGH